MTIIRRATAIVGALVVLVAPAAAEQEPPLADLLKAGAAYLASYTTKASGVSLEEQYTMSEVSSGRISNIVRIASDLLLLNPNGSLVALRDALSIDAQPLRDRQPRMGPLLAKPTLAAWSQALEWNNQSLRHFRHELILRLNDPVLALRFLAPANHAKLSYKIDGSKRVGGVEATGLRFQETAPREAAHLIETRGNAAASGRLWIDPATGAVLQSEISFDSVTETARVSVTYARDKTLDLWLPSSMVDVYDSREGGGGPTNMGRGPAAQRTAYECRATFTNARHTPIDLTKTAR